ILALSLEQIINFTPSFAREIAEALPSPWLAAVTRATLLLSPKSILSPKLFFIIYNAS
mgnify:CR=1